MDYYSLKTFELYIAKCVAFTHITKRSILDVAATLDPPLISALKIYDIMTKLQTIENCYWMVVLVSFESERIDKSIGNWLRMVGQYCA